MDQNIRLAFARTTAGETEIYSPQTRTKLVLPAQDVELLIGALANFSRSASIEPGTVFLDLSSEICANDKT